MVESCLCCGKKIGVFAGGHLDKTVCDSCFFKFAGYLETMRNSSTRDDVDNKYSEIIKIVKDCNFAEEGYNRIVAYIDEVRQEKFEHFSEEENVIAAENEKQEKREQIKEQYRQLRRDIMLTTSSSFEGYDIIEYCAVKSGSVVLGTGFLSELSASLSDLSGSENDRMSNKIEEAKASATNKLIENCIYAGGNAIVGIEYDMMTIGANMIVVSANGTAVKVKAKKL